MNKSLILVVEDDTSVRNLITTTLKEHEYRYLTAPNGQSAILEASSHNPDIVLLDLGLPDMDGVEIIKKIRTWSNMPIIVISARSEDTDKIDALDAGADDYLTKPFSVEELLARLRVTQRRLSMMQNVSPAETVVFVNGKLRVDYVAGCAYLNEEELHLTPIEYKLLCLLTRNIGKVLTHTKVSSWADLLAKTMNTAFDLDAETITDLATKDYSIPYATRIYISNDERKIRKPKQIDNSGIYFEANLSANGIISFIKDLLAKLQLDTDDFSFSLSEVPFDIDNEDTWAEGLIPVAKLFYNFVENLVEKGLIDSAELENLKTKEYTKNLFQATDYPAIANSRTDNMGNSLQKRYRAKAINFNGTDIYVSTQFFDSDRDAVIDWYRSHL